MTGYLIPLAYTRPPLSSNQRLHWRKKAKITAELRSIAKEKMEHVPFLGRCEVSLTWYVTDARRRDVDNIVPTLKVLCDAVVDAGIVSDDTPDFMLKRMPEIVQIPKAYGPASLSLLIEEI